MEKEFVCVCVCFSPYGIHLLLFAERPVKWAGLGDTRYPAKSTNHQEITEARWKIMLTESQQMQKMSNLCGNWKMKRGLLRINLLPLVKH